jgi:hypothetical protein
MANGLHLTLGPVLIVGAVLGCASSVPPYYGSPYSYTPYSPQTRVQGAQALPPQSPRYQMQFGPSGSTPAEYRYGPDVPQVVEPASGSTPANSPNSISSPPPSSSSSSATNHAPDYSWIRGRLEKSHIAGGRWLVRYAPVSQEDPYGGAVVLEGINPEQYGLSPGEEVYLEGTIVENTTSPYLRNPGYRVRRVQKVRR